MPGFADGLYDGMVKCGFSMMPSAFQKGALTTATLMPPPGEATNGPWADRHAGAGPVPLVGIVGTKVRKFRPANELRLSREGAAWQLPRCLTFPC